jgi:very-short-patch-repair endonuclease
MAEAEPGVSEYGNTLPLPGGERATRAGRPERGEGGVRYRTTAARTARARKLRRERTEAEEALWQRVRAGRLLGYKFRTQAPIGRYHPDFCCPAAKLIVELDGSQHAESDAITYDAERTAFLESQGYRVLRFWNNDVLTDMDAVVSAILRALSGDLPLPAQALPESPSPLQGEGKADIQ